MDNEKFVNEFLIRLGDRLSTEELRIVSEELTMFAGKYDITPRETALMVVGFLPECYRAFIVAKKIEGMSETSLKNYHVQIKRFFDFVQKTPEDVTTNDIRMWLYYCQHTEGVAGVTVNNKRVILNSFFSWCTEEGYLPVNPCRKIGKIRFIQKERQPLTHTELEMVREACILERDRAMVEFLYSTGCRVSEMINVRLEDVDIERGEVHVLGKGSKERTVYLNERAIYFLRKYMATRDDSKEWLFVSKNKPHNKLATSSVHYIMEGIEKRAGLGRTLHPHLIRHTTATDAVDHGMPIVEVQKMLGHSNLNTTMIYAKVSNENLKAHHRQCIV